MRNLRSPWLLTTMALSVGLIVLGTMLGLGTHLAAGVLGAIYTCWRAWHRSDQPSKDQDRVKRSQAAASGSQPHDDCAAEAEEFAADLVSQSLKDHRYAVLLQPSVAPSLSGEQLRQATDDFEDAMAVVPSGPVLVEQTVAEVGHVDEDIEPREKRHPEQLEVDAFYMDRFAVTNRQYQQFVDAGGYEEMEYWQPEIWPEVLDFVDQTGEPGPRFWRDGRYATGRENHPVVGICWYEAAAYAQWAGKRLPTDAEWVKAAAWPVKVGAGQLVQRRYPWGAVLDRGQANLWSATVGSTVAVEEFAEGASVGGVYQLVGNAWEWTADAVGEEVESAMIAGGNLILQSSMKSIRGGAYDTYFDVQATTDFRSAERPTIRKHNIGFRCVVDAQKVSHPATDFETHQPNEAAVMTSP